MSDPNNYLPHDANDFDNVQDIYDQLSDEGGDESADLRDRYTAAAGDIGHADCDRCAELWRLLDDLRAEMIVAGVVFDA